MEQDEKQKAEQDKVFALLERLNANPDFQEWRKLTFDFTINQLEAELASKDADNMPEAILRGKIKHLNSLRYFSRTVFDIAREQKEN